MSILMERSAFSCRKVALLLGVLALCTVCTYGDVLQVGGGNGGWKLYQEYPTYHFAVGDTINFSYTAGQHNVRMVAQDEFDKCTASNNSPRFDTGNDLITFTAPGVYYFICSFPWHCSFGGMKVAVMVT